VELNERDFYAGVLVFPGERRDHRIARRARKRKNNLDNQSAFSKKKSHLSQSLTKNHFKIKKLEFI
jgi:hypothetical protein